MKTKKGKAQTIGQEINVKAFLRKVLAHKKYYLLSVGSALGLALLYIVFATPKYEVATSLLIDPSGSNRSLGESQYVDGGVGLIEMEKNLFNEIGIIKSYKLIQETVKETGLDITYGSGNWLSSKEYFNNFPFEVEKQESSPQIFDEEFEVKILNEREFMLSISASNFKVSVPQTGGTHEVRRNLNYSEKHVFGKVIDHEYFSFKLLKTDNAMGSDEFKDSKLHFVIHDPEVVTKKRMKVLSVDNIDIQASIFRLVSVGPMVEKETAFLNGLTANYMESKLLARNKIASSKESFIREQLEGITDSLLNAELNLEAFKQGNNAIDLSTTATNAMNRTQRLQMNRAKIQLDIQYYRDMIQYIENNRNSESFILPNAGSVTDPLLNKNIAELQTLYSERSRKRFYVTSGNEEISILNEQIRQATRKLIGNLNNAIASAEGLLGGVQSQLSSYNQVINTLPTREKQLISLQREKSLYENLFNYLSQELAKTGIARAENTSDTQILDEARMEGTGPVAPQKSLLMLLAFTVGLLVPTAWLVWFAPEDVIESEDQIRSLTKIPVIASVVRHENGEESGNTLWQIKESFRDMCANLRFVCSKGNCVIGMTSIMPEEGKTYCTINLGITFAEAGKKILVIDADIRKPSVVKGISKEIGMGLSDYLRGDTDKFDDLIYTHEKLKNLHFIPTAIAENNVHELLSNDRLARLIKDLRKKYDYIIIDTPAVGIVSDILLFWDLIDINLFVMRRQVAKVGFIKDMESLNQKGRKKKSFIIFNDALRRDFKYGYGPKYGLNEEEQLVNDSLSV